LDGDDATDGGGKRRPEEEEESSDSDGGANPMVASVKEDLDDEDEVDNDGTVGKSDYESL